MRDRAWPWFAFAALCAIFHACLLPLWEGFDEPFHYAFVRRLAASAALPSDGPGELPADVSASLLLAPASAPVKRNLPQVTTYSDFFKLSPHARAALRLQLDNLPRHNLIPTDSPPNYESQQAPLAYILLAPFNALFPAPTLPADALRLRLLCALAASLLHTAAALALARLLILPRTLFLLLALTSQVFYAATAHTANDWLAVALSSWFAVLLLRYLHDPRPATAARLAALTAAGLLTKAYFLAWAATAAAALLWKSRTHPKTLAVFTLALLPAAPFYLHNIFTHHSLSGMIQLRGAAPAPFLQTAASLPWSDALPAIARAALFTGNSSFNTLSRGALNLVLLLTAAALIAWLVTLRRSPARELELALAASLTLFLAALLYVVVVSYASTQVAISTSPWYTPAAHLPLLALVSLGAARAPRPLALALSAAAVYLFFLAHIAKLIPMYAGCDAARVNLASLHACYSAPATYQTLAQTALGPAAAILTLAPLLAAAAVALAFRPDPHLHQN